MKAIAAASSAALFAACAAAQARVDLLAHTRSLEANALDVHGIYLRDLQNCCARCSKAHWCAWAVRARSAST